MIIWTRLSLWSYRNRMARNMFLQYRRRSPRGHGHRPSPNPQNTCRLDEQTLTRLPTSLQGKNKLVHCSMTTTQPGLLLLNPTNGQSLLSGARDRPLPGSFFFVFFLKSGTTTLVCDSTGTLPVLRETLTRLSRQPHNFLR